MNIRFYNAKIVLQKEDHTFALTEGELWVKGDTICYVLMPGFKDAHTHTAMTFLRSYADDLPLQEWLNEQVFPKEAQLTAEDVYDLSVLGIMEYLTSGITSNFDMYNFPRSVAKASADCGFRNSKDRKSVV